MNQLIRIYSVHKHSCLLYVGSILVDEYAVDPGCVGGLLDMLQVIYLVIFVRFSLLFKHSNIVLRDVNTHKLKVFKSKG